MLLTSLFAPHWASIGRVPCLQDMNLPRTEQASSLKIIFCRLFFNFSYKQGIQVDIHTRATLLSTFGHFELFLC